MAQPPVSIPGLGVPVTIPAFDNTLGALLVGGLLAMALWGVTCVQAYTYFMSKPPDRPMYKLMVAGLWFLDTFDSALNAHILYYYMVSNYLNPLAIMKPVWSVIVSEAFLMSPDISRTPSSSLLLQDPCSHHTCSVPLLIVMITVSKGNIPLTAWLVLVSTLDLAVGIYITVQAFKLSTFLELDSLSKYMYLNFASGTTSDLSVALSLCYYLYYSRTGIPRTDSLIKVLMMYTVNTGLIVAVDAALGTIFYAAMPHNLIFLAFYLLLSKLYLNSYLATLNARGELRERLEESVSIHLSQLTRMSRLDNLSDRERSVHTTTTAEKQTRSDTLSISVKTLLDKQMDRSSQNLELSPISPSEGSGRAF
ncbi:hypothetical protein AMATHDRAFT_46947 [Amanita thiersii Skay4041]|uniref:DUF6534 domain-containing protein n=1 Tax=Amanita thiersii Skay4041 TaxID=703135 RepID=A0A2A9NV75_9AGAR|nr:hypothetical protein AMATHDRAFT_46947 [Amanita thiersii Skay4041]